MKKTKTLKIKADSSGILLKSPKNRKARDFDKVKVFYKDIKIEYPDDLARENNLRGQALFDNNLIKLDAKNEEKNNISVLIHEILHIAFTAYERKYNTEETVNDMTNIFCTLIKDNKDLFKNIINEI